MDVVIGGGHGKIGMRLGRLLAEREDRARGLIRKPEQARDLESAGIEPVVCDLEDDNADVAGAVAGADAVVFAAGAGPGSGAERKRTMDYGGAVRLIEAAKQNGVRRYLIVSAMGAGNPPPPGEGDVFGEYLRAKADADAAVRDSGLDHTIVRPGGLTDDPGTGRVRVAESVARGQIPRDDVAAVLLAALDTPSTVGVTFELVSGDTPIDEAVAALT
ncbi:MAG: SDR family oxidoreductase [Thermoleophilaceae bacterium]